MDVKMDGRDRVSNCQNSSGWLVAVLPGAAATAPSILDAEELNESGCHPQAENHSHLMLAAKHSSFSMVDDCLSGRIQYEGFWTVNLLPHWPSNRSSQQLCWIGCEAVLTSPAQHRMHISCMHNFIQSRQNIKGLESVALTLY
eukprot:SAG31_NODE_2927_length_4900_cov_42.568314_1_plen_143_part_00